MMALVNKIAKLTDISFAGYKVGEHFHGFPPSLVIVVVQQICDLAQQTALLHKEFSAFISASRDLRHCIAYGLHDSSCGGWLHQIM